MDPRRRSAATDPTALDPVRSRDRALNHVAPRTKPGATLPGTAVGMALALFAALLLLAPPASNWVWAVDGFRSVPLATRVGLLAAAAALGLVGRVRSDS